MLRVALCFQPLCPRALQITHSDNDERLKETRMSAEKKYFQEERFYTGYPYSSDNENISVKENIPYLWFKGNKKQCFLS